MPARLRSINSLSHSPKQRNRKSVSLSLASLALSRRSKERRASIRMSRHASILLDDGDTIDGDSAAVASRRRRSAVERQKQQLQQNENGVINDGVKYGTQQHHYQGEEEASSTATPKEVEEEEDISLLYPMDESPGMVQPEAMVIEMGGKTLATSPTESLVEEEQQQESSPRSVANHLIGIVPPASSTEPSSVKQIKDEVYEQHVEDEAEDLDELVRAGNEALLFIYGHNINFYTDIFSVKPTATPEEITLSYTTLMNQIDFALNCTNNENDNNEQSQKRAAVLCGMKIEHMAILHPMNYCEIQKDAVQRAHDILMDGQSREEYDALMMEYELDKAILMHEYNNEQGSGHNGEDDGYYEDELDAFTVGTRTTAAETETDYGGSSRDHYDGYVSSPGAASDFWSEDNTIADQLNYSPGDGDDAEDEHEHEYDVDIAPYGSHGEYSYNCNGEDEDVGEEEGERAVHLVGLAEEDSNASELEYSYHTGDEEDESFGSVQLEHQEEGEEGSAITEHQEGDDPDASSRASVQSELVQRAACTISNRKKEDPPEQYSPTDPLEFDQLIQDSVPDQEYINQFSRPGEPTHDFSHEGGMVGKNDIFDPFGLYDGHDEVEQEVSPVAAEPFPEFEYDAADTDHVPESTTFLCKLPTRDDDREDDDDDELTMGDLIERQESASRSSVPRDQSSVVSDLESVTLATETKDDAASSKSVTSKTPSTKSLLKKTQYSLQNLIASMSGSVSGKSGNSSAASSILRNGYKRDVIADGEGSIISHLTDEMMLDGASALGGMEDLDELDCFGSKDQSETRVELKQNEFLQEDEVDQNDDGLDCFSQDEEVEHPDDEGMSTMRGAEPDGPNLSADEGDAAEMEIETFLSIASTFSAMKDATSKQDNGGPIPTDLDFLSRESFDNISHSCSTMTEDSTGTLNNREVECRDAIDCFPSEIEANKKVRFKIPEPEEEVEYSTTDNTRRGDVFYCLNSYADGLEASLDKICGCG